MESGNTCLSDPVRSPSIYEIIEGSDSLAMTTIFCDCGRIIDVDSIFNEHCVGSGKRAICHFCRNRRV